MLLWTIINDVITYYYDSAVLKKVKKIKRRMVCKLNFFMVYKRDWLGREVAEVSLKLKLRN